MKISESFQDRVSYLYDGWDPVTLLGNWAGVSMVGIDPFKYAPDNIQRIDIIGNHIDYFSRSKDGNGVTNLTKNIQCDLELDKAIERWYTLETKFKWYKPTRIIMITVVLIISIFSIYIFNGIAKPGTKITEAKLKSDLGKLGNGEVKVKNKYIGMVDDDFLKDKELKTIASQVENGSHYIQVSVQNKEDFSKPLEVRYGMRVWLYLSNHELPYPISVVKIYIDKKWVMDGQDLALIQREEFQQLYSEISKAEHMNDNEIIGKLTDLWIKKHNYQRRELK
ncbi:hypothetical protein [Paenibacillus piri]|uniref:Uncharacterized protein n=1 Tax=Paenibacillus piri TaxID=2547395 RepID=A0A4R5KFT5_9BACL|nr:hypothetical protein [Paenibacillus piri]TDF94146.1 hypothetical protein E1757_24975 [Paenibacillus piri]